MFAFIRRIFLIMLAGAGVITGDVCEGSSLNVKKTFSDKRTVALVKAAQSGDVAGVQAAVQSGANPNDRGQNDATPLIVVMGSTMNQKGLAALMASGADPNLPSTRGATPMSLVARGNSPELLRIFLKGGGNPNLKDESGNSLLHLAQREDRWENVETLLENGADINAADDSGYTIVMRAALLRKYERVIWLVDKGADAKFESKGSSLASITRKFDVPPASPQFVWRQKVLEILKARGVPIPQEPL